MEMMETHEKIHEAAHGHGGNNNSRIAMLIGILAVLLAIVEMGGKGAQNTSLAANIEAANLWAFFQAKSIRLTTMKVAADGVATLKGEGLSPEKSAAVDKLVSDWRATAERYDNEPATGEGRKQLSSRAKEMEARRDRSLAAYHVFEYGSAALQIAIVLASSSIVTGARLLTWGAMGLGVVGILFGLLGWFAPTLIHL